MSAESSVDTWTIVCTTAAQTQELGRALGAAAENDQCLALDGDLGIGKTELVRGLAAGAGASDDTLVSSPTYVLLNIYPAGSRAGAKTVFHLDAYRIADESGFDAVGWDDLFGQHAVIVVEWAQRVQSLLPHDTLFIVGDWLDANHRRWTLSAGGRLSKMLLHAVKRVLTIRSLP